MDETEIEYHLHLPRALGLREGYTIHWIPGVPFCTPYQTVRDWEIIGPHGHMRIRKNGTVQVARPNGKNLFTVARKLAMAARFPNDLPENLPVARVGHRNGDSLDENLENLKWLDS